MDFARFFFITAIMSPTLTLSAHAATAYHLQMSLEKEDNGGKSYDIQRLTGAMRYAYNLSSRSVVNLNADIYHQTYPDISSWSSDGMLLEVIYNLVTHAGFTKPMYSILLRHETASSSWYGADFNQSTLIMADTFRLDDRQSLSFGGEMADRSQGRGNARLLGVFLNTDLTITDQLLVYLNLKVQRQNSQRGYKSLYASTYTATQNNKTNHFVTLGANYEFNAHHSIDLSYQSTRYDVNGSNTDYSLLSFDYFYKF